MMKWTSLRKRLWAILLVLTGLVWLIVSVMSYNRMLHEADEILDAELMHFGQMLLTIIDDGADGISSRLELLSRVAEDPYASPQATPESDLPGSYRHKIVFQLWDAAGRLLSRSASAPGEPLANLREGYGYHTVGTTIWRTLTLADERRQYVLQVAEDNEVRKEISVYLVQSLLFPGLFGLALLSVLIWQGVSAGLAPLTGLAKSIRMQAPRDLRPIPTADVPLEVQPLVQALNSLFQRLSDSLDSERRFTREAAHELRTPLAALKLHIQLVSRSEGGQERAEALEHVHKSIERAERLVAQLLEMSRLDSQDALEGREHLDLGELAADVISDFDHVALGRHIRLSGDIADGVVVEGAEMGLVIIVRNLVDNALRYTQEQGEVIVRVFEKQGNAVLEVEDNGPGIPFEHQSSVFKRFWRYRETATEGSGLGLSIVKRIADLHGAKISVGDPKGHPGFLVRVSFMPSAPAGLVNAD